MHKLSIYKPLLQWKSILVEKGFSFQHEKKNKQTLFMHWLIKGTMLSILFSYTILYSIALMHLPNFYHLKNTWSHFNIFHLMLPHIIKRGACPWKEKGRRRVAKSICFHIAPDLVKISATSKKQYKHIL